MTLIPISAGMQGGLGQRFCSLFSSPIARRLIFFFFFEQIGSGSLTYEFGDHGGIIVTAPYDQKTSSVQYSWDQGLTWTSCSLPNQIAITNIVVEPKGASQNFIIYGTNPVDDTGLIYFLNLTSLHQRDCELLLSLRYLVLLYWF